MFWRILPLDNNHTVFPGILVAEALLLVFLDERSHDNSKILKVFLNLNINKF